MRPHTTGSARRAVILTALEVEHAAIIQHLSGPLSEHDERGLLFDIGSFEGRDRWIVAVAQAGPGNLGAGIVLERAVTAFRPDVAIFVGIAGGRKDVRHGDVVVADAVYDYETGKRRTPTTCPGSRRSHRRSASCSGLGRWRGKTTGRIWCGPLSYGRRRRHGARRPSSSRSRPGAK